MSKPLRLFVEETPRKVFVSALDWPGLARGAKTEDLAVESLVAHLPRYAKVAHKAGERFDPHDFDIEVVEPDRGRRRLGVRDPVPRRARGPRAGRRPRGQAARLDRRGVVGRVRRRRREGARSRSARDHAVAGATGRRSSSTSPGADGGYARSMGIKGDPETAEGSPRSGRRCWRCSARRPTAARSPTRSGRPGTPPGASRGTPSTTPGRSRTAPSATDARYDRAMEQGIAEALVRRAMAQASIAAARGDAPFGAVLATPDGTVLLEAANAQATTMRPHRARRDRAHP